MEYIELPADIIDLSWSVLRSSVKEGSQDYQDLKESIKQGGIRAPLLIRRISTQEGDVYSLIDGRHRLTIAKELALPRVPCMVLPNCTDSEAMAWQLQMNVQKVETTTSELARQLGRLYSLDKTMSQAALARLVGKTTPWVQRILSLNTLPEEVLELVDYGDITIGNAALLAKAPAQDVPSLIASAKAEKYEQFEFIVNEKIKKRRAHRTKDGEEQVEWEPTPKWRKLIEVVEAARKTPKGILDGIVDVEEAFKQGALYAVSLDTNTVLARKFERTKSIRQDKAREAKRLLLKKQEEAADLEVKLAELEKELDNE